MFAWKEYTVTLNLFESQIHITETELAKSGTETHLCENVSLYNEL